MSLSELGMWAEWSAKVIAALPNFAANPIYVEQASQSEAKFEEIAAAVATHGEIFDDDGRTRDAEFGARVVKTVYLGPVTRMWLDGNVEIDFLRRHLPGLSEASVIDIGAGYGRLAVMLRPFVRELACVDAVPISTELCQKYVVRFCPDVFVWTLPEFEKAMPRGYDLAINIHSWNECKLEQIAAWLDALAIMQVPYLFTVSHGRLNYPPEQAYTSWDNKPWRWLLEAQYDLLAEESLGLSLHPHALWRRKT